jgi:hypothetical protein
MWCTGARAWAWCTGVVHGCGARVWCTGVVYGCGARVFDSDVWCTGVVHRCGCGAREWCTGVVHGCGARVWCTGVRLGRVVHGCGARARVWYTGAVHVSPMYTLPPPSPYTRGPWYRWTRRWSTRTCRVWTATWTFPRKHTRPCCSWGGAIRRWGFALSGVWKLRCRARCAGIGVVGLYYSKEWHGCRGVR